MNDQKDKNLESVKNLLGEPVFIGLSDYVLKLRRNLVALSAFIIFYKSTGAKISIFGFNCTNLDQNIIDKYLVIYLLYSASHFFFEAWETYLRWVIRLSGTFKEVQPPPQTLGRLKSSPSLKDDLSNAKEFIQDCAKLKYRENISLGQSYLYSVILQLLIYNKEELSKESTSKLILQFASQCAEESLKRFREKFKQFQLTQIIRFLAFDIFIPLGLTCIAFLYTQI